MEKNFEFETFQQVLVRNRNFHPWEPMLYGYPKDSEHVCAGVPYSQCIPYTPETAHLLGTSQPYEPPVDEATRFTLKEDVEVSFCGGWVDAVYLAYHGGEADPHVVFESGKVNRFTPSGIRKKAGV